MVENSGFFDAMLYKFKRRDWGEEQELEGGGEGSGKTSEVDGVKTDPVD